MKTMPPVIDSSPKNESNRNYSRWMTEIAENIAHLKLNEMALPSAHNSGADRSGMLPIEKEFGANQDNSFPQQLAAGARVLDLRLYDDSYKKIIGNHSPKYRFVEVFQFRHGHASAGRRLEHLIRDVRNFVTANPGEIVILDFHKFDKGRQAKSLDRCLPYFTPIKHLLIPRAAADLMIGQIRGYYPGRSIILSFQHGRPEKWATDWVQPEYMWDSIKHEWNSDLSEAGIEFLVNDLMQAPNFNHYLWALSACVYNGGGPKHLKIDDPIRTIPFNTGAQNVKILMADFIERTDTRISVIDRCIELNLKRRDDNIPPSEPTNFTVKLLENNKASDDNDQNTVKFTWAAALDNLGVGSYEIMEDDIHFAFASARGHLVKDLHKKNATYKVRAYDNLRNFSAFSNEVKFIQDTVPPTLPTNLHFTKIGYPTVSLAWTASYDWAGIAGYEIRINGNSRGLTDHLFFTYSDQNITEEQIIEVRAKDINGFYSEWVKLIRPALPAKLDNPQLDFIPLQMNPDLCEAHVTWDTISNPHQSLPPLTLLIKAADIILPTPYVYETPPAYTRYVKAGEKIRIKATLLSPTTEEWSEEGVFEIDVTLTPPSSPTDFKIVSQTTTGTVVTWTGSIDTEVVGYAISLNEEPPLVLSASVKHYEFKELPTSPAPLIELWAIDVRGNTSLVSFAELLDIIPPGKPGTPVVSNVTGTSATLTWVASTDNVGVTGYQISLGGSTPILVTELNHKFINLKDATAYSVEVRAIDAAGNHSDPSSVSFSTPDTTVPGKPGGLTPENITGTSANLRWTKSTDNVAVAGYKISLNGATPILVTELTHTFSNLKDGSAYSVEVRAIDAAGNLSEPASATFTTLDVTAPSKPTHLTAINVSCRAAILLWKHSSDNLRVNNYEVLSNGQVVGTTETSTPGHLLTGLVAGDSYSISVRALDEAGNRSLASEPIMVITPVIGPPKNVRINNVTANSVNFAWDRPDDAVGLVGYHTVVTSPSGGFIKYDFPAQQVLAAPLQAATRYQVSICAYDAAQIDSEPVTFEIATAGETARPSAPKKLRLVRLDPRAVYVEWEASEGPTKPDDYNVTLEAADGIQKSSTVNTNVSFVGTYYSGLAFELSVTASNKEGISPPTILNFIGDAPASKVPSNFRFTQTIPLIPTLEWDAPSGFVSKYHIVLTGPQGTEIPYESIQPILKPLLLPRTRYQAGITARDEEGISPPLIAEFTTK
jgi:chitodextrinase